MESFYEFLGDNKSFHFPEQPYSEEIISMVKNEVNDAAYFEWMLERNGGYYFNSSLHFYGFCTQPNYHNIITINQHLTNTYQQLSNGLFAFAEDIFGNQFCFEADQVVFFNLETAEREVIAQNFDGFLIDFRKDIEYYSGIDLLSGWLLSGNTFPYGNRLCAKIPFVIDGKYEVDNLYLIDAFKNIAYNASLAHQIYNLPDGTSIQIKLSE